MPHVSIFTHIKRGHLEIEMLAIGADELHEPLGDTIKCGQCGQRHKIEYDERSSRVTAGGVN